MSDYKAPLYAHKVDQLQINVYESRQEMGTSAAEQVMGKIRELLNTKDRVRMIFAAAPSQNEFLEKLAAADNIDWERVTVFNMDDYVGLPADSPQRFSAFLNERLFNIVQPGVKHLIDGSGSSEAECERYEGLLQESAIDIVCLGIGENGHLAFNDPPVADFNDPAWVKPVNLDDTCRQQQVNDGCFATFADVPMQALTLTIPALLSASHLFCIVPGASKRNAVKQALYGPIDTECPASILRQHSSCTLFLDVDAYGEIPV